MLLWAQLGAPCDLAGEHPIAVGVCHTIRQSLYGQSGKRNRERLTGLGLRDYPGAPLEVELLPAHGQDIATARAGQKTEQDVVANGVVGLVSQGGKERRQLIPLQKAIARLFAELADAGGWVVALPPPIQGLVE